MWPITQIQESLSRQLVKVATQEVKERVGRLENENWLLQESLSTVELELENASYRRITQLFEYKFDRHQLLDIVRLAIQMAVKNPITNRSVNVQADYVFGRGVQFKSSNDVVQGWIDEFVEYRENRKALTSGPAMRHEERCLQVEGNRYVVLNTNRATGRVIVRMLSVFEVQDIIRDPDDYHRELFIRRTYRAVNGSETTMYHPILWIQQGQGVGDPWEYEADCPAGEIQWDAPVLPIAFNKFGKEKFAVTELYPQLDWANSYKKTLEGYVSIISTYARMALKLSGLTGKKQAAGAKSMLNTTVSLNSPNEKNPSPTAGNMALLKNGMDIEAIKTSGATTPPSEFGPVLDMAASGAGLPSYFFGNSSKANDTLDRPTELKMKARQSLWTEVFTETVNWVVYVRGCVEFGTVDQVDLFTGLSCKTPIWPAEFVTRVAAFFPDILEHNVTDRVRALVNAITLFGKPLTDIIPDKSLVARLLMEALGLPEIEKRIPEFVAMWQKNLKAYGDPDGKPVDANIIPPAQPAGAGGAAEDPSQGGAVGANG